MWLVDGRHLRGSVSTQPVGERPLLLQSWKAQREELVCVEVFGTAGRLWVLTASTDGSASMWTQDGDHVGCFSASGSRGISLSLTLVTGQLVVQERHSNTILTSPAEQL